MLPYEKGHLRVEDEPETPAANSEVKFVVLSAGICRLLAEVEPRTRQCASSEFGLATAPANMCSNTLSNSGESKIRPATAPADMCGDDFTCSVQIVFESQSQCREMDFVPGFGPLPLSSDIDFPPGFGPTPLKCDMDFPPGFGPATAPPNMCAGDLISSVDLIIGSKNEVVIESQPLSCEMDFPPGFGPTRGNANMCVGDLSSPVRSLLPQLHLSHCSAKESDDRLSPVRDLHSLPPVLHSASAVDQLPVSQSGYISRMIVQFSSNSNGVSWRLQADMPRVSRYFRRIWDMMEKERRTAAIARRNTLERIRLQAADRWRHRQAVEVARLLIKDARRLQRLSEEQLDMTKYNCTTLSRNRSNKLA